MRLPALLPEAVNERSPEQQSIRPQITFNENYNKDSNEIFYQPSLNMSTTTGPPPQPHAKAARDYLQQVCKNPTPHPCFDAPVALADGQTHHQVFEDVKESGRFGLACAEKCIHLVSLLGAEGGYQHCFLLNGATFQPAKFLIEKVVAKSTRGPKAVDLRSFIRNQETETFLQEKQAGQYNILLPFYPLAQSDIAHFLADAPIPLAVAIPTAERETGSTSPLVTWLKAAATAEPPGNNTSQLEIPLDKSQIPDDAAKEFIEVLRDNFKEDEYLCELVLNALGEGKVLPHAPPAEVPSPPATIQHGVY